MSTKKNILMAVVVALVGAVPVSMADDTLSSFYQNEYVSFGGGATYVNKIFQDTHPNRSVRSGILGAGGNLFIGSALSSFFGLEFGVNYFSFGSNGGLMLLAINGKFTELLGDNVLLYEKVGPGYGEVTTRFANRIASNSFAPSFGLGIGYHAGPHWLIDTEFDGAWFPNTTSNCNGVLGGITIGGTYYFNA